MKDLISYVRECWRTALDLRERSRQMWALLAAIFALPVVWLMGGRLEPTHDGVFWIAVWATTSALFTLFVVAPFHLWRDQKKASGASLGPDFPIRDLFLHLDPMALEEPRWLAVGQAIKDSFAVGRLQCWGRPIKRDDWIDEMVGWPEQPSPDKIEPKYWQRAGFTYNFFGDWERYVPHTNPELNSGLATYKDLMVNKAQVMSLDWSSIDRFREEQRAYFDARKERREGCHEENS